MFIVSAIILSVLLTWHNNRPFTFYVGKPWLYQDLTASMSFKVPRDTAAVVDSLNANFIKVYERNDQLSRTQLARLSHDLSMVGIHDYAVRQQALSALEQLYRSGIVPDSIAEDMKQDNMAVHLW